MAILGEKSGSSKADPIPSCELPLKYTKATVVDIRPRKMRVIQYLLFAVADAKPRNVEVLWYFISPEV